MKKVISIKEIKEEKFQKRNFANIIFAFFEAIVTMCQVVFSR